MKELTARRADADRGRGYFAEVMTACSTMMQAIVHLAHMPVVAAVQGVATSGRLPAGGELRSGGGVGGRNVCDPPGSISDCFVRPRWWRCRAMFRASRRWKCCLPASPVSATTARALGLVNRVVAAGTERAAAIALAQKVALKSAYTVKLGKQAFLLPPG